MASLFDIRDKAQKAEGIPQVAQHLPAQGITQASPQTGDTTTPPPRLDAARRTLPPFTDIDGQNYRAIYRAVCEYHEQHNPPRLELEYWEKAANDLSVTAQQFNNDPFANAMLIAVYDELEREYKALETAQATEERITT